MSRRGVMLRTMTHFMTIFDSFAYSHLNSLVYSSSLIITQYLPCISHPTAVPIYIPSAAAVISQSSLGTFYLVIPCPHPALVLSLYHSLTDAMQNLHIKGQKKNTKASNKALKKAHRVMPDFVGIVMEGIVGESGVDSEPESYVVRSEDMIMSIELKPPIASRKTRTSIFQRVHDGQTATQAEYIHSRKKQAGDRVPVIVGLGVYWQYNEDDSTGKPFPTISIGPARPIPEAIAGIPEVLVVPSDPNDSPTQSKERGVNVSQGRQAMGADIPKAKKPGHSGDPPRESPEKKDTADVKRRKLMEKLQMAVNNFSEEDVACEIDRIVAMHYDIGIRLGTVISCYVFMLITKRIQHLYPTHWHDLRQQTDGKLVPGKSLGQAIMEKNIFYREAMASSRELQTQQAEEIASIRKELAEREKRIEALNAELQAYIDATAGSSDRGLPVKEPKSGKAKKGGK